ncbi:MAG: nucleotidyltransferase domain-containing protein [Nitrospirota bacterium]
MKIKAELPENLVEIAILTLKNRLLKELGNVIVSIVFFGSRYRGRFTPDSDIDILIIVKDKNPQLINRIFEIADNVEWKVLSYRFSFSLHIQSEQEHKRFKDLKSPFISEIENEGEIIHAGKTKS